VEIGDTALPAARFAGGSMGTASWGTAVVDAARRLRARLAQLDGVIPAGGHPKTARSQLLDAMTMGLSMALHEESVIDPPIR
jgi:CO/xanthine dehydrogenase Mo-binding subunit